MEKRQLGNSDLWVSKMGLGCMSLGTDSSHAKKIIQAAFDQGINYFDTADLYDYGVNEEIVGKTLSPIRDQVIIATKVGNRWNDQKDGWHWDPSKTYIKDAVKNSLKRLQTDYIDLYQLHGGTIDDPSEETIEAFEELQEEGLIRCYGISSIRPNVIKLFAKESSIVSNMMQYSLLDRRPEELFPFMQDQKISVVTRGSVAKGLLSDKVIEKLHSDELPGYLQYTPAEIKELIESIQAKLLTDRTMNEVALQYTLAHETVAAVVTGASSIEQVQDNSRAVKAKPLHKDEIEYLKWITKDTRYENHR
ncbi:aldo/keto reductase [Bacillus sp. SD088]|uniref:aldo/keto reductase n=1 Tax=Bacillus sp. SD088 TaxID=2782012 RepID=UPI001A9658B2|nr:aldo/keto reductase [Bacillus sp. SD088]MBO0995317.1 aldo/keto reductase [Bacillus sp. SD088]